ncbi:guanine nucleotide-releasing factor 2 isoform X2 [Teleopsis dalmanni]|uniref:guanine nucleotide-releasing factor 2 isoform X2 n=1 Tax=Teleopsis dalmanni TaxID=139649 RepID=UPI0018CF70EF|nr:guanine nucleotide-releasing factor 2 isoform X2 [Teleopsis dalmanni]
MNAALHKIDNSVDTSIQPNILLSSHSKKISTPTRTTASALSPTQLASVPNTVVASVCNTSGHKNSLKGTKLARRARSFKDDLFEKISLIRTPTNTLGSPGNKNAIKLQHSAEEMAKSSQSLETYVKDISNALKHFKDVILKKKLEVLPGNGTVILDTIASMYSVIQSYMLNENSTLLLSATQQVYQCLGKLIKFCDEVMLSDEDDECVSLSNENVRDVVDLLEDAVKNLVSLAQQKLKEKEHNSFDLASSSQEKAIINTANNSLMRPPIELAGRTSLPDITLTPKERDILEKTNSNPIRASHSTESILRDTSPPPKPPLPNRSDNPPPIPPKRRSQQQQKNRISNNISINSNLDCGSDISILNVGVDHLSVRSRSPDENSSQCSLDSALNQSREEEELKILGLENSLDEQIFEEDVEKILTYNESMKGSQTFKNEENKQNVFVMEDGSGNISVNNCAASVAAGIHNVALATMLTGNCNTNKLEMQNSLNNRHSNESGFASVRSFGTSSYSVSKRSSDYSFESSTKSSSSEIAFGTGEAFGGNEILFQQKLYVSEATAGSISSEKSNAEFTDKILNTALISKVDDNQFISHANRVSSEHIESDKYLFNQMGLLNKTNSLDISSSGLASLIDITKPALPPKLARNKEQMALHSENFEETDDSISGNLHEAPELRQHNKLHQQQIYQWQSKHQSLIEPRTSGGVSGNYDASGSVGNLTEPPPLPIKKKHMFQSVAFSVLAYMEICSASTRAFEQHRHTVHSYNLNRNITHSQTMNIVASTKDLKSPDSGTPPALPPKNYKQRKQISNPPTIITTPPQSPKPLNLESCNEAVRYGRVLHNVHGNEQMSTVCEEIFDLNGDDQFNVVSPHNLIKEEDKNEINVDKRTKFQSMKNKKSMEEFTSDLTNDEDEGIDVVSGKQSKKIFGLTNTLSNQNLPNMLEEIDITPFIIFKKESEDGPEVKGGYIDALIVHASRVQKNSDNAFSEAFITTFRTFILPVDVIEKLTHRYTFFFCQLSDQKQKAAKETFSLLVRVVNDLTSNDLTNQLLSLLVEFVYQLVCSGQLYQAKLLRNKIVEKVTIYKEQKMPVYQDEMHYTVTNQPSLLDLKSSDIAEQMTLLDANLFQKIEIPEVLLFAKEQCEEKSPNLNKFTEHFNKMSYWARSKILMLSDAKDREKHVIKFIKIMKHLRKMNNYNSYLALLSALDSAPIRRLEWQKTITEGLKEYCTLIDSSSSFRAYRQALAETTSPCIPYIGLVLQDLTFVHVGNPDYLKEGVINFSKRWQQYNIIDNMKRFKKCTYPFRRNERIIRFFENFENFLGEEEMWQISETIKPRCKRPTRS